MEGALVVMEGKMVDVKETIVVMESAPVERKWQMVMMEDVIMVIEECSSSDGMCNVGDGRNNTDGRSNGRDERRTDVNEWEKFEW